MIEESKDMGSTKEHAILLEQPDEQQIVMHSSGIDISGTSKDEAKNEEPEKKVEVEEPHNMKMSIDIRTIKGLKFPINAVIYYKLPLFGAPEFQSHPPINVPTQSERKIQ